MTKPHQSLKSAAEDKTLNDVSKSLPTYLLDPRKIAIEPGFNARPIYPDHVAYMKQLQADGVDTGYLIVQMVDGAPIIRDGHHRLTAVMERIAEGINVEKVKVLEFKGDEVDATFFMLGTQSGQQYTPLEVGGKYAELVNIRGLSYAQIAKRRGKSVQHVKDCISLTQQPVELKEMITSGAVKATTALKLVKKEGSKEALKSIKEGIVVSKGKPITQKVIDNLAKNVITDAQKRTATAREHIAAMLDSPAFDGPTKAHLRDTLALLDGKVSRISAKAPDNKEIVQSWLSHHKGSTHSDVQRAANLLHDLVTGKPIPDDNSGSAQFYSHMVWLQDMAAHNKDDKHRAAAHWFMAVLNAKRTGSEIAPAPSMLSLADALEAEMQSGGTVFAESLCPEKTALINYIRGRK